MHRAIPLVLALFSVVALAIEPVERGPLSPDPDVKPPASTDDSGTTTRQVPSGVKWLTLLEVLVDKDGRPADIRIVKSSGNVRIDRFAVQQSQRRDYEIRFENGEPVDYRTEVRVAIPVRAESPGQPIDPLPDK